jgi:hypothetical protein
MKYSLKNHAWAVIQSGQCVFGTGRTREAAIRDAEGWMSQYQNSTHGWLEAMLESNKHVNGDIYITNDSADIRFYVENQ